ncbi:MAG: hypothetical protein HY679_05025, partial [Chloroflexi bacterium]|nr:hypothetical protein [Chloroflexota bacterium]
MHSSVLSFFRLLFAATLLAAAADVPVQQTFTGAIAINGGAAYTNNSRVALNLSTAGNDGSVQMRFSNDGASFTSYEPITDTASWTLPDATSGAFIQYSPQPTYDPPPSPTGSSMTYGMLLSIPDSAYSDRAALIAGLHVPYSRISIDWPTSEPTQGNITFNSANDIAIAVTEAAGLRPILSLFIDQGWMNGQTGEAPSQSYPPSDLTQTPDPTTAYSPSYYNFVYQFVLHYSGHFDYIAIENEENSSTYWGGTADEYVRVVKTAYKAIKDADPNVKVMDGGMVSSSFGLCIANDWITGGLTAPDAAYAAVVDYSRDAVSTGSSVLATPDLVASALSQSSTQASCAFTTSVLANLGGAVDLLNFHFYESADVLHLVPEWLQRRMSLAGYSVPIFSNEMGQRGTLAYASTEQYARNVFRKLVTANSLGLQGVVWFATDTVGTSTPAPDKISPFNPDRSRRPAADTFQLVVDTLLGQYRIAQSLSSGPDLYRYLFQRLSDSTFSLEAAWSITDTGAPVGFTTPTGATTANFTDFTGQAHSQDVSGGTVLATGGDGTRTVYAQFYDGVTETVVYSGTVFLDTTRPTSSILINSGANVTTSPNVVLSITADDSSGAPLTMQFSQ